VIYIGDLIGVICGAIRLGARVVVLGVEVVLLGVVVLRVGNVGAVTIRI
jgi:hypothetical protein